MTGSQLLDAAIGVVFVILSFSLVASALSEALATVLNWRGRMLRRGLFRLLEGAAASDLVDRVFPGAERMADARLTQALLADPAISVLHGPRGVLASLWDGLNGSRRGAAGRVEARAGRLPSAIPAASFARALVDTLARQVDLSDIAATDLPADAAGLSMLARRLEAGAGRILRSDAGPLARIVLAPDLKVQLRETVGSLAAVRELRARLDGRDGVQAEIEAELRDLVSSAEARLRAVLGDLEIWFDRAMDRVSGWYTRRSRLSLFVLGAALAASINASLISLGGGLLRDDDLRAALVARSQERVAAGMPKPRPNRGTATVDDLTTTLDVARDRLTALPGRRGPGFGWSCAADENWPACVARTVRPGAVMSWLLIGLGCMMGGQFWYDFLGTVLRFRPAARSAAQTGQTDAR